MNFLYKMKILSWFLVVILCTSYLCEAYRILLVFPMPAKSHSILGDGYARHLLAAGHEVTYITAFPASKPHPNLRQIDVSSNLKYLSDDVVNVELIMKKKINLSDPKLVFSVLNNITQCIMEDGNVLSLLNDPLQQFDLVIAEWMLTEVYCGFAAVFDCPYIWSSSVEPHWLVLSLIDESTNPAYVADCSSANVPPLSFGQRVSELRLQLYILLLKLFYFNGIDAEIYEKHFGPAVAKRGRALPPFHELKYNASMVLGNSHYSLGQPTRLPQSYKAIGGYHIDTNLKPLPEDLKTILDNAKNGVIYFSLGSNIKSKDLPSTLKQALLKMFGTLKYTIIWKFEDVLPDLPKNVHILKWAPQPSILAHPNCILFITHGGLLSTTETIHFAVPIVGIPVFADQFNNVDRAIRKGFGKRVDLSYSMADDLKVAIEDILADQRYRQKVKQLSALYHDRPVSPGAELVHWVQHVVRTRGAPHLRSPALQLSCYQKAYLDLLAVVVAAFILIKAVLKRLFSLCFSKKSLDNKKKRN